MGAALSLDGKGIGSEEGIFACQPVHGCLERARGAAHRRVPLTQRRGQVLGDLLCQRAPEAWSGSALLRPLARLYREVMCFHILNQFRGVHHRRHIIPPCPRMRPRGYGGCRVRSTRCAGTACGVVGGTVLTSSLSSCHAHRVPPWAMRGRRAYRSSTGGG